MRQYIGLIAAFLDNAEVMRPVVRHAVDVLKSFGPEMREIMDGLTKYGVENRIACIKQFEDAGFTRQEAILLTVDLSYSLRQQLEKLGKNKT